MTSRSDLGTRAAIPRFIRKPLAKISHTTTDGAQSSRPWSHLKERDDLYIVLDHVNALEAGQGYIERRVLRVVCGADIVVSSMHFEDGWGALSSVRVAGLVDAVQAYLNLDERLEHSSMEQFRHYGSQVPLDQLPLGVLVRPPNLRVTYVVGDAQKRMLQLKFQNIPDCQEMAAVLEKIGLPVRTGVLLDRPASQRLSTAGSWAGTTPDSQPRNIWSSHESSSSQTIQAHENSVSAGDQALSLQPHRAQPMVEHPRAENTMMPSPLPNILAHSLEYPAGFPGASSYHSRPTSAAASGVVDHNSSEQAYERSPHFPQPYTRSDLGYSYAERSAGSSEGVPPGFSSIGRHPRSTVFRDAIHPGAHGQDSVPSQSYPLRVSPAAFSSPPTRGESHPPLGHQFRSPEPSFSFSNPSELYHRPSTAFAHNVMPPPPVPERVSATRDGKVSRRRNWAEQPRPPSRRSDRLAFKSGAEGFESHFDSSHLSRTFPSQRSTLDLPPARELPFPVVKAPSQASPLQQHGEAAVTEEDLTSIVARKAQDVPDAKKKVAAKKPRKAASKPAKAATTQSRKRLPKKAKVSDTAEATTESQTSGEPKPACLPILPAEASATSTTQLSILADACNISSLPTANQEPITHDHAAGAANVPCLDSRIPKESRHTETLTASQNVIDSSMDNNFKESIRAYLAGISPYLKEIGASFQRIAEITKEFTSSS